MTFTQLPDAINYLVDIFTAAATLGAANPIVTVYDGPAAMAPGMQDRALYVAVSDPGFGGDSSPGPVAAEASWRWAALGAQKRYEEIAILCCAVGVDANSNMRAARQLCADVFSAAGDVVKANLDLGGRAVYITGMTSGTMRSDQFAEAGAVAWMTFAVEFKTRV